MALHVTKLINLLDLIPELENLRLAVSWPHVARSGHVDKVEENSNLKALLAHSIRYFFFFWSWNSPTTAVFAGPSPAQTSPELANNFSHTQVRCGPGSFESPQAHKL